MQVQHFLVNKNDLNDHRWLDSEEPEVESMTQGSVLLALDSFALTANNITYAVAGERMNYWDFFPTEAGWGQVPVWGFATVVGSNHPGIALGERFYGYLPIASHLRVQAEKVTERGFIDGVAHRAPLAAVYNQYVKVDPNLSAQEEAAQMLYRPLFMTSFMLDDYLADADCFGAKAVILTSASSKTALGLAALLHARENVTVVGITSARNQAFVSSLGCYDEVLSYQELERLDAKRPSVIVDMAGNGEALATAHNHLDQALKQSVLVGATHWDARSGAKEMAGPTPELFFAPAHIAKRVKEWGPGGLDERFSGAWSQFVSAADDWVSVDVSAGLSAIESVYGMQLAGEAPPDKGYILSF
ncbi:MAG: DUF2855 family protein [Pseudomonadales bacterium]